MRQARATYKAAKQQAAGQQSSEVRAQLPAKQARAVDRAVSHSTGQWFHTMDTAANGN